MKGKGKATEEDEDEQNLMEVDVIEKEEEEEEEETEEEEELDDIEEILLATLPEAFIVGVNYYRGLNSCASFNFPPLFLSSPYECLQLT